MSAAFDLPRACHLSPNDPYWLIHPPLATRPPPISVKLFSPNPKNDLRPGTMPASPAFEKIPPAAGAAPMPAPPAPDEDGANGGVPPTAAPGNETFPPAPQIG